MLVVQVRVMYVQVRNEIDVYVYTAESLITREFETKSCTTTVPCSDFQHDDALLWVATSSNAIHRIMYITYLAQSFLKSFNSLVQKVDS
jgi:hypothetical protein